MINGFEFNGIINGFVLDDTLIDGDYVICDIESQVRCLSKGNLKSDDSLYDKFVVLLNGYLNNNPEYIIFKNVICDFTFDDLKKLKLLFRDYKKKNICKFIICSKNLDIIADLCDYVTDNNGSYTCSSYFKKNCLCFSNLFVRELEKKFNKKFGVIHNDVADLAKDVYRYVK